jgi:hypothetical protein
MALKAAAGSAAERRAARTSAGSPRAMPSCRAVVAEAGDKRWLLRSSALQIQGDESITNCKKQAKWCTGLLMIMCCFWLWQCHPPLNQQKHDGRLVLSGGVLQCDACRGACNQAINWTYAALQHPAEAPGQRSIPVVVFPDMQLTLSLLRHALVMITT